MPIWLCCTLTIILIIVCSVDFVYMAGKADYNKEEYDKNKKRNKIRMISSSILFFVNLCIFIFAIKQSNHFTPTRYTALSESPIYYTENEGTRLDGYIKAGNDDNGDPKLKPIYSTGTYNSYYYADPITHKRHDLKFNGEEIAIAIEEGNVKPHIEFRKNWCGFLYQTETVFVTPDNDYKIDSNEKGES